MVLTEVLILLARVEGGVYSTVMFIVRIQSLCQKYQKGKGLYLKMKAFFPTCQELVEVSLYSYHSNFCVQEDIF